MHGEKLHAREPGDPVTVRQHHRADRKENAMSGKSFTNGGGE
jgi:hypothetical protein